MYSKKRFPILKDQYALHKGSKYSYVYENSKIGSKSAKSIIVNEDAARIINECDGKTSLDQIVQKLSSRYHENSENIKDIVESFISTNNYFSILEKPTNKKTIKTGHWNVQVPRHVSIELTYHCNFKCKHCYNKSAPQRYEFIDGNWLLHILDDLKNLGVDLIEFTGGEPLTHPKFNIILKHSLNLFSIVSIITNGYLLTKNDINLFSKYKDKLMLQISFYGTKPSYVNWFSDKKGAFERSLQSIKLAAQKGIFVTSSMIVTPLNLDDLFSAAELSKSLGAKSFRISTVVPLGRADKDHLHFSKDNIKLLTDKISNIKETFGDFILETPEYLLKPSEKVPNCGAGTKAMTITPNGDVKICPLANTNQLYLGNLHSDDINSILSKSEKFNFFEINDPRYEICGKCKYLWFCEGCIARGSQMYSDIGNKCYWGEEYFIKFIKNVE